MPPFSFGSGASLITTCGKSKFGLLPRSDLPGTGEVLSPHHARIGTVMSQQTLVRALFHHPAVVQDHDQVGVADGAETMGYGHGGALRGEARNRFLDQMFGFGVHRRSRLIEDQNGGVFEQRPRNGQALLLPGG